MDQLLRMASAAGLFAALLSSSVGCSNRPPRLKPPELDATEISKRTLEKLDLDGDDVVSATELEAAHGIRSNLGAYDKNSDGAVSKAELDQRFQAWADYKFALNAVRAEVYLNGKPLAGATVRFEPAFQFEGQIKPASGVTDEFGVASIAIADEDLPKVQQGLSGVHTGTYLVRITHPDKDIPAKYNSETTLGYEPQMGNPMAPFDLKN